MKFHHRKKFYLVVDTETTSDWVDGKCVTPLVYDLGFAICDRKGKIYETGNFVIANTFYNRAMNNAFYKGKRVWYTERIENGEIEAVSFAKAIYEINKIASQFQN